MLLEGPDSGPGTHSTREAAVYAIGSWGHQFGLPLLTLLGRVRLLGAAMAWPWLLVWASELSCRCGTVTLETGHWWPGSETVVV